MLSPLVASKQLSTICLFIGPPVIPATGLHTYIFRSFQSLGASIYIRLQLPMHFRFQAWMHFAVSSSVRSHTFDSKQSTNYITTINFCRQDYHYHLQLNCSVQFALASLSPVQEQQLSLVLHSALDLSLPLLSSSLRCTDRHRRHCH
jgi:hypothetical protein